MKKNLFVIITWFTKKPHDIDIVLNLAKKNKVEVKTFRSRKAAEKHILQCSATNPWAYKIVKLKL